MVSGAGARRKGHDFERIVAKRLQAVWPEAMRGLQYRSGDEAPDVDRTPYWIECKRGKQTSPKQAYHQAMTGAASRGLVNRRPPVAVTKDDGEVALVTMALDDFIELARKAKGLGDGG